MCLIELHMNFQSPGNTFINLVDENKVNLFIKKKNK